MSGQQHPTALARSTHIFFRLYLPPFDPLHILYTHHFVYAVASVSTLSMYMFCLTCSTPVRQIARVCYLHHASRPTTRCRSRLGSSPRQSEPRLRASPSDPHPSQQPVWSPQYHGQWSACTKPGRLQPSMVPSTLSRTPHAPDNYSPEKDIRPSTQGIQSKYPP